MICCSVEQHGNGISHVCNWRSYISACYEELQWRLSSLCYSSPLPPSGQGAGCTFWSKPHQRMSVFVCLHVSVWVCRCQGPVHLVHGRPVIWLTRARPPVTPLLGPLDIPGWGWIFISSGECVLMHVHLDACVWWVCNLSDTSQARGRDTRGDDG